MPKTYSKTSGRYHGRNGGRSGLPGRIAVPGLNRKASDYGNVYFEHKPEGIVNSGGRVTQWTNAAGGYQLTQSAANGPKYIASALNGYPAIDIGDAVNGDNRYLSTAPSDFLQNRSGVSLFFVNQINDTNKYINGIQWSTNGSTSQWRAQWQTADGTNRLLVKERRLDADTLTQTFTSSNAYTPGVWNTVCQTWDFVNGRANCWVNDSIKVNNVAFTGGGNSENTNSAWALLGNISIATTLASFPWVHLIGILGVTTYGQRIGLQNYLNSKYFPTSAPTLSSVTSLIGRWECRKHPSYASSDSTGTETLSELKDVTGNGNRFIQTNKALQPTFNSSSLLSTFAAADGTEMFIDPAKLGLIKNQAVVCFTAVFKPTTAADGFLFFISNNGSATNYRFGVKLTAAGKVQFFHRRADDGTGGVSITSTNSYDVGQMNLVTIKWDGVNNAVSIELNETATTGAVGAVSSFPNTDSLAIYLGSSGGSNYADSGLRGAYLYTDTSHMTAVKNFAKWELF